MAAIIEDQIMHALELASEASERAGKWATPPEVTAFGKTGEVGLNRMVTTDDLNALVQEGRAESKTTQTGYFPEQGQLVTKQLMYRPQQGGGPATSKAQEVEGPRKPKPPRKPEGPWDEQYKKGPREPITTKELLGEVPGGSVAPGSLIGGVGGAVGRQIL